MSSSTATDTNHDIEPVLQALSSGARRAILSALLRTPSLGPRDLSAVRDSVDVTESSFEVALHHVHFPGLEASGLATYERHSNVVERGPRFEAYRPLIECIEGLEDRTARSPERR